MTIAAMPAIAQPVNPPRAPERPIAEQLHGTTVIDRYRWMETAGDPEFRQWLLAQGGYARAVLAARPDRAAYREAFTRMAGGLSSVLAFEERGRLRFVLEQRAGAPAARLLVREGGRERVLIDPSGDGGAPSAISAFWVSPDGRHVLVTITVAGGASTRSILVETASGRTLGAPLDRTDPLYASWSEDGSGVFVSQLREPAPDTPAADAYLDIQVVWWPLVGTRRPIAGTTTGVGPVLERVHIPSIESAPGAAAALLVARTGVARELTVWTAPAAITAPDARWTRLAQPADRVTAWALRGPWVYLLSQKDAPNGKILRLRAGEPLASARIVLPHSTDRVIDAIAAARDGLYVATVRGAESALVRINDAGRAAPVALPFRGALRQLTGNPMRSGLAVRLESWARPPGIYRVAAGATPRPLAEARGAAIDPTRYRAQSFHARSHDGMRVPLSAVRHANARGPGPFLLSAYGAYGFPQRALFNERIPLLLDRGAGVGTCHVRGGGELGAAWRFGGKDANKPNSWKDLIACAETLIAAGVTSPGQLVIRGLSAGGITVGRAMTERPELFAGVVMGVPLANPLRSETQANGPANVPEFGSVATESGFRSLMAMDSYHAVRDGVEYPAVLLMTGVNDMFVPPWQPGKMAARLQATGMQAPVLLRVETQGGHGGGPTIAQRAEEEADLVAFLFWRAAR